MFFKDPYCLNLLIIRETLMCHVPIKAHVPLIPVDMPPAIWERSKESGSFISRKSSQKRPSFIPFTLPHFLLFPPSFLHAQLWARLPAILYLNCQPFLSWDGPLLHEIMVSYNSILPVLSLCFSPRQYPSTVTWFSFIQEDISFFIYHFLHHQMLFGWCSKCGTCVTESAALQVIQ